MISLTKALSDGVKYIKDVMESDKKNALLFGTEYNGSYIENDTGNNAYDGSDEYRVNRLIIMCTAIVGMCIERSSPCSGEVINITDIVTNIELNGHVRKLNISESKYGRINNIIIESPKNKGLRIDKINITEISELSLSERLNNIGSIGEISFCGEDSHKLVIAMQFVDAVVEKIKITDNVCLLNNTNTKIIIYDDALRKELSKSLRLLCNDISSMHVVGFVDGREEIVVYRSSKTKGMIFRLPNDSEAWKLVCKCSVENFLKNCNMDRAKIEVVES